MSSTAQKHRILRAIAHEAKPIRQFDDGNFGVCATQILRYVAEMESAGLLVHHDDDKLTITDAGLAELNRPTSIATPRQRVLDGPVLQVKPWQSARIGADDHKRFKSLA